MDHINEKAAGIVSIRKIKELDEAGLAVVPKEVAEKWRILEQEVRALPEHRAVIEMIGPWPCVIHKATPSEIGRIEKGYVVMD